MKKLFTLLTMLIVAISMSWAQDSEPTLDVEFTSSTKTDWLKSWTTEGITLSGDGSFSSSSGIYYGGCKDNASTIDGKYFGIAANSAAKKIVKVSIKVSPNSSGKTAYPVFVGWSTTPSLKNVACYKAIEGTSTSTAKADAEWITYNLKAEGVTDDIQQINIYRKVSAGNFYESETATKSIGNGKDLGAGVTLRIWEVKVWLEDTNTPVISANDIAIAKDATTEGEIAFTVANPVTGGVVTAAKKTTADWLTLGTVANGKVPFSATANTGAPRNATVTLTYTYTDGTEKTVTKDVTITQAAPTYAITYNPGNYGEGSIEAGEKSYGVDFTLSSKTFSRDEYVQTGWATVDGGEQAYALGSTYSENAVLELYPVWEAHATKGTSIIKATLTSNTEATVTGSIGGAADVKIATTTDETGGYKFGSKDQYFGLTLTSGFTFKTGDIINVHTTTTGQQGTIAIYDDDKATILYNTGVYKTSGTAGALENIDNKFVLPAAVDGKSTIYICRTNSNNWNGYVDFIEVTRPNATITLNAKGFATYSKATDFEFAGAKAYKMALNESAKTITGTAVTGKIAAGEGILFKGEAGATVSITETTGAEALTGNNLKGTTTASGKATVPTYCYTLSGDTFKKFKGAEFNDNKAYLESTQDLSGQSFEIIFDDQPTAISFVVEDDANVAVAPVKVIKNGQLFIGNYNVAGARIK